MKHEQMKDNTLKKWNDQVKVGQIVLPNRIVMAALTRQRAPETGIPNQLMLQYYSQRASMGMILTQCTTISERGHGFKNAGKLFTKQHMLGWKKIVQSVHSKKGIILNQIFHVGRAAHTQINGGLIPWAPSSIPKTTPRRDGIQNQIPKQMTTQEIGTVIKQFKDSASLAKQAGFDGVQLHGAHGYLVDSFIRSSTNKRQDEYGGSIQNRCRFCLQIMDELIKIWGCGRVGIKVSPVSLFNDMYEKDGQQTYGYLFRELQKRNIAFIQIRQADINTLNHGKQFNVKQDQIMGGNAKIIRCIEDFKKVFQEYHYWKQQV